MKIVHGCAKAGLGVVRSWDAGLHGSGLFSSQNSGVYLLDILEVLPSFS